MAAHIAAALHGAPDEAVEVNQRALIDKVLARYSGEQTVYRELLQNADDASASHVEIQFSSTPASDSPTAHSALPDLATTNVYRVQARNDGFVFRDQDWARLRKIAEGNPDENMIGAFGVGYYSVFSICDDPMVVSGEHVMGFAWSASNSDQLVTRRAPNPAADTDLTPEGKPWTTFHMSLREPAPMPKPADFARFLATSLSFTTKIKTVRLLFDQFVLCEFNKQISPARTLNYGLFGGMKSPRKMLNIRSIDESSVQIDAKVMKAALVVPGRGLVKTKMVAKVMVTAPTSFAAKMLSAFSSSKPTTPAPSPEPTLVATIPDDSTRILDAKLFLRVVTGNADVSVTSAFSKEIERATKKPPPKRTQVSLIWTNKDDWDASTSRSASSVVTGDVAARSVFDGLLSGDLEQQGRIFIGFQTHQTTGCAAHVAARFIPTVERESLDLQAPYVTDWNRELLGLTGALARIVFEAELRQVQILYKQLSDKPGQTDDNIDKEKLVARCIHAMKFFSYQPSTPSPVVGSEAEQHFFTCSSRDNMLLPSSKGPQPCQNVRFSNPDLVGFIKEIPILPLETPSRIMQQLRERAWVKDVDFQDVFTELKARPLNIDEMRCCLTWFITLAKMRGYDASLVVKLKSSALLSYSITDSDGKADDRLMPIDSVRTFANIKTVPSTGPFPLHTLPFDLTKSMKANELVSVFGFEELSLHHWIQYLLSSSSSSPISTNLLESPIFAESVLNTLAKSWSPLSTSEQARIVETLKGKCCIPTRKGMKSPEESYHSNVTLFADLAVVTMPSGVVVKGNLEKTLTALGVRRHVELQMVFSLLGKGDWSHVDLIKYLLSVRETLTSAELDRLRKTAFLPREGDNIPAPPQRPIRKMASELYEPSEVLRDLGLPLLAWEGVKWRSYSEESKFLISLGLKSIPSLEDLLQRAADLSQDARRLKSLRYFLDNYDKFVNGQVGYKQSYTPKQDTVAFVPCIFPNGQRGLTNPLHCFGDVDASVMGFTTIAPEYLNEISKFKSPLLPSSQDLKSQLLSELKSRPKDAGNIFSYLSSKVSVFSRQDILMLTGMPIIPIEQKGDINWFNPFECFFGDTESTLPTNIRSLFTYIDFGVKAKPFLTAVGVRTSPTTQELTERLLADPQGFYNRSGSPEQYTHVLRTVAANHHLLSSRHKSSLRKSSFMLGAKRVRTTSQNKTNLLVDLEDDDDTPYMYTLARPEEVVIIDDAHTHAIFAEFLLACPQEDTLEQFAESLGSPRLSRLIGERYEPGHVYPQPTERSQEVSQRVIERTSLFLHERQQHRQDIKHDAEWLKKRLNVQEVRSLTLTRELRFRGTVHVDQQSASATAVLDSSSSIVLLLAPGEIDWFEVAASLCRLLLHKQRLNDALLFSTILAPTLKTLKRRGMNVDRIMNARKAEKAAVEQREREARLQKELHAANQPDSKSLDEYAHQLQQHFPDADPAFIRELLQTQDENHYNNVLQQMKHGYPKVENTEPEHSQHPGPSTSRGDTSGPVGMFNNWKKRFANPTPNIPPPVPPPGILDFPPPYVEQPNSTSIPESSRGGGGVRDPRAKATPQSDIRSNLLKAISASQPDSNLNLHSKSETRPVKESESTYCDASGIDTDLAFVTDSLGGIRFYVSRKVTGDFSNVVEQYGDAIRRYASIIKPVGDVFDLDPRSLHMFYDLEGPLIAFNRNGSLFLNLRFYIAWYDDRVKNGDVADALIGTFSSLAHELAHNLVIPHNSEHEWWMSAFFEQYFLKLATYIGRVQSAGGAAAAPAAPSLS